MLAADINRRPVVAIRYEGSFLWGTAFPSANAGGHQCLVETFTSLARVPDHDPSVTG